MHHNTRLIAGGLVIFVIFCALYVGFLYIPLSGPLERGAKVQLAEETISVVIADDEAERSQGLSGTSGLDENEGMLFIFDKNGIYSFWMKDMSFAIDIIWISDNETIVHIAENVTPESYPTTFSSIAPARYVLELPAGWVRSHFVRVGDTVSLP